MPPSPPSPSPSPILTHWADKQFDVSMASILVLLVVATILAFTIHALLRFLLRLYRRHLPTISTGQKIQNPNIADSLPSLVFTSTTTTLAGGAECAICLSEFADGERVRVMPACNHGFHVKCVEGWLAAKASCPTCRTSCRPVAEV